MPAPPTLATLPPDIIHSIASLIGPRDIRSLRLLDRATFQTFAAPSFCHYLLQRYFPFAVETSNPQPTAYDALNCLLNRLYRTRYSRWTQSLDLSFPPAENSIERVYPGFHIFDPTTGALVTANADLDSRVVEIVVRWLGEGGRTVVIPAPLELTQVHREGTGSPVNGWLPHAPPEIYYSNGRLLLIYAREIGPSSPGGSMTGTLAMLLDGKSDGRTLWSALFSTPIFPGVANCGKGEEEARRRLEPVFNSYYLAFLTSLSPSGTIAISRHPPLADPISPIDQPDTISCGMPVRPENLQSLKADSQGQYIFAAEAFPTHDNIHRVVLINAHTGDATRAYHMPIAPAFALAPRDWTYSISPNTRTLLIFASARDPAYRSAMIGQLTLYPLDSNGKPKIRYLLAPNHRIPGIEDCHIKYDFNHNCAILLPPDCNTPASVLNYSNLALDDPRAGNGEVTNNFNTLKPTAPSDVIPPFQYPVRSHVKELRIGKNWVYLHSWLPDTGETVAHLLRLCPVQPGLEVSLPKSRQSWLSGYASSGFASPRSLNGTMHSAANSAVVDAGELARRLNAVSIENGRKVVGFAAGGSGGLDSGEESGGTEVVGRVREKVKDAVGGVIARAKSEKYRGPKVVEQEQAEPMPALNRMRSFDDIREKKGWRRRIFGRSHG